VAKNSTRSIIFITGAFIGNNCWNQWQEYFENKGYNCISPCWPNKEKSPEELRNRHPDPAIASNRLNEVVDYFEVIINTLQEKPILIGHSMGGLIVQLLLQRRLGSAGIAIHSFPPFGVCSLRVKFISAIWEAISLFTSKRQTYLMPFRTWAYVFTNGMDCEQQKELYYRYATPESKRTVRETFTRAATIDFKSSHSPLLLTSGSNDNLVSSRLNYCNYKMYKDKGSVTNYKNFEGHPHLVFDNPAWKTEADFILLWLHNIRQNIDHS
jgi:pimeloyl-ACP methyl ester carboxylesterase